MLDPFDILGIAPTFDVDLSAAERRYRDLSRILHPDKHVGAPPAERRMALGKAVEVNEAWRLLRDPIRRAEALFRRSGIELREGVEPKADPEFLMEMMEQREALSDARAKGDRGAALRLGSTIRTREKEVMGRLSQGFGEAAANGTAPRDLLPLLGELRYYRRFLDEVSAIEDLPEAGPKNRDEDLPEAGPLNRDEDAR
jgi:molecular chaperone HscB